MYAPANSPEAVAAAAEHGATDVEVDLHSWSDGLAITHDGTIARGAGAGSTARWISQLSSTDYARRVRDVGRKPVFLEDIVERAAASGLGLYLDIKQLLPGHEVELERVVADFGYVDRVVAASASTCSATRCSSSPARGGKPPAPPVPDDHLEHPLGRRRPPR